MMKINDSELDSYCFINSIKFNEKLLFEIIFKNKGVNIVPFNKVMMIVVKNIENPSDMK
ncbi:MAG: hypothetical protein ACRCWU_01125 [Metamycoplasmataceae bacterium]